LSLLNFLPLFSTAEREGHKRFYQKSKSPLIREKSKQARKILVTLLPKPCEKKDTSSWTFLSLLFLPGQKDYKNGPEEEAREKKTKKKDERPKILGKERGKNWKISKREGTVC